MGMSEVQTFQRNQSQNDDVTNMNGQCTGRLMNKLQMMMS